MAADSVLNSLRQRLLPESSIMEASKIGPPVAAVAIIINPKLQGGSVLFIERSKRSGDPWSGQVAFPGGRKAPGDRSFRDTAMREASEEVGIQLAEHEFLGVLPLVTSRSGRVVVVPFVFLLNSDVTVRVNDEVAESFWVPLDELQKVPVKRMEVHVEEGRLQVNAYNYCGHTIWGLTFRMINLLLMRRDDEELA